MKRLIGLFLITCAIALGCARQGVSLPRISLALPIDCQLGKSCFVLQYPDRDPGPNAVDYGCGRMTYDAHRGTDFAVSDEAVMRQGVAVQAVADGKVLRVRDGVSDRLVRTQQDQDAVEGSECGNGLVIDHGNGWETQYCHLRKGSVSVQPGQFVKSGDPIGFVGASGLASFPHVHLTLRYQGEVVDPSVGITQESGCKVTPNPLWSSPLPYKPTGLMRSGVAAVPPTLDQLWAGQFKSDRLSSRGNAVIFWVQMYGLLAGDEEYFEIRNAQGDVVISDTRKSDRPNRIAFGYVGKRFDPGTIPPGQWTGFYELKRNGNVLVTANQDFVVTVQ